MDISDRRLKGYTRNSVKIIIGVVLLFVLFLKVDSTKILLAFQNSDYRYYLLGFAFFGLLSLMDALRMYVALHSYSLSYRDCLGLYTKGTFFSNFMPGDIGSEVYRVYFLHKVKPGLMRPIALMVMLRFTGFGTLILMTGAYVGFNYKHIAGAFAQLSLAPAINFDIYAVPVGLLAVVLVAAFIFYYKKKGMEWYNSTVSSFMELAAGIRGTSAPRYAAVIGLTVIIQFSRVFSFYFFVKAFGADVAVLDLLVVTAIAIFASFIPISFASLGIREGVITGSLFMFGVDKPSAMAVAIMSRFTLWGVSVIGGVLFLMSRYRSARQ